MEKKNRCKKEIQKEIWNRKEIWKRDIEKRYRKEIRKGDREKRHREETAIKKRDMEKKK